MLPRYVPVVLTSAVLMLAGCTRASFGFRPSLTSQVPDSTVVRIHDQNGGPLVTGRALDWRAGRPRVVTAAGDTVVVSDRATLQVRLKEKRTHATLGGVIGLAAGLSIKLAQCPPPDRCGPDLTPVLTAGFGALIGSRFSAVEWVRVRRDPPADSLPVRGL